MTKTLTALLGARRAGTLTQGDGGALTEVCRTGLAARVEEHAGRCRKALQGA